MKLQGDGKKPYTLKTEQEKELQDQEVLDVCRKTYVSRQTGAMREQRKAWA